MNAEEIDNAFQTSVIEVSQLGQLHEWVVEVISAGQEIPEGALCGFLELMSEKMERIAGTIDAALVASKRANGSDGDE